MTEPKFPDGNDRTPNDPCVLLSAASLKRLYEAKRGSVSDGGNPYTADDLVLYVKQEMTLSNWDEVEFINGQTLLKKNLNLRKLDMLSDSEPQQSTIRVTVTSRNAPLGKTVVLRLIENALQTHGFRDIVYDPEDNEIVIRNPFPKSSMV